MDKEENIENTAIKEEQVGIQSDSLESCTEEIQKEKKKSVFIIPSRVQIPYQSFLLKECIKGIQEHHPDSDIVLINDCTNISILPEMKDVIMEYIEPGYENCGEVYAYVWACKHYEEYETFVMMHDSTKVLSRLPLEMIKGRIYRQLWHSGCCIDTDTRGEEMYAIMRKFSLDVSEPYNHIQNGGYHGGARGNMIFGAMGIFTKEFARRLATETNFIEVGKMFNKRQLRCFFERLLYCIVYKFQNIDNFRNESVCGCIFNHGNPFKNITPEGHAARNPYVVKCWQSR